MANTFKHTFNSGTFTWPNEESANQIYHDPGPIGYADFEPVTIPLAAPLCYGDTLNVSITYDGTKPSAYEYTITFAANGLSITVADTYPFE